MPGSHGDPFARRRVRLGKHLKAHQPFHERDPWLGIVRCPPDRLAERLDVGAEPPLEFLPGEAVVFPAHRALIDDAVAAQRNERDVDEAEEFPRRIRGEPGEPAAEGAVGLYRRLVLPSGIACADTVHCPGHGRPPRQTFR
jgi:hypothetical protein